MEYTYELKETLLDVTDVGFSYEDGTKVLNGLSFTVRNIVRPHSGLPQGQIVGLLGKSGIGKSTLLKLIGGQLKPQTGSITMLARQDDPHLQPPKEGNVGIVYQDYLFFEHLTVKQLLRMGARQGKMPDNHINEAVDRIMQEFGLKEHENKWRQELSGGQRQRVSIAQQLLLGRQILILDEPFSGLDYAAKMKVAQFIQKVAALDEFKTILLITHDIESCVTISDSIYLLAKRPDGEGASVAASFNLMDEGIAWRPDNHHLPQFHKVVQQIKDLFLVN